MLDPAKADSEIRTNCFAPALSPFQGEKVADYASKKLSAKSAAVIFETGSDLLGRLKDAFVKQCESLGIQVVATRAMPPR
jgi:branched-chain amino acid transport system substrate-binding protein